MTEYRPFLDEHLADPYPQLARMRAEEPVHFSPVLGAWLLTRHEDVAAALRDPRLSARRVDAYLQEDVREHDGDGLAATARMLRQWMIFADPPQHAALRQPAARLFAARLPRLRRSLADFVAARTATLGEGADFMSEIAHPLTTFAIAEVIGVPEGDRSMLAGWSRVLGPLVGRALRTAAERAEAEESVARMAAYVRELAERQRDGFAASLREALPLEEVVATCILLFFGGQDTSANFLGNALIALARHPGQLAWLRAHRDALAGAIEELLRFDTPVQMIARRAAEEVAIGGRRIAAGERISLSLAAANRDPAAFPEPDRLDLQRQPRGHAAFGGGLHACLGAALARLEAEVVLEALLDERFPDGIAPERVRWIPSCVLRGPLALPLHARTAAAAGGRR